MCIEHGIVHAGPGQFNGWPANNGMWGWGDELLVRFHNAYYDPSAGFHNIDRERSRGSLYARSVDGGESWSIEHAGDPFTTQATPHAPAEPVDFTHPDFAMRIRNDRFCVSRDRGRQWSSLFALPSFGIGERLTARTDYIVRDPDTCILFLSIEEPERETDNEIDRALCAATTDGGLTFDVRGWITADPDRRSIMPATVSLTDGSLLTVIRQTDFHGDFDDYERRDNYLEAFHSDDDGVTWTSSGRLASTHNPAAACHVGDNRVVVVYGYRTEPHGIRARMSPDGGGSWGEEIVLRGDGLNPDLGYPRMIERPDGRLVLTYYYCTAERPEQHIASTIWNYRESLD